jgi:hypothetical protein
MNAYTDQVGEFLIQKLESIPPESQLETTIEMIEALSHHLGALTLTVQKSGRLSEDELGTLFRAVHAVVTPVEVTT